MGSLAWKSPTRERAGRNGLPYSGTLRCKCRPLSMMPPGCLLSCVSLLECAVTVIANYVHPSTAYTWHPAHCLFSGKCRSEPFMLQYDSGPSVLGMKQSPRLINQRENAQPASANQRSRAVARSTRRA
jgi:hypothetical protein